MVKLYPQNLMNYTLIPNDFIEHHLADSNGDFVKIYILLLSLISKNDYSFSTNTIADTLNLTESDVVRALRFWHTKKLIDIEYNGTTIVSITFTNNVNSISPTVVEEKSNVNKENNIVPINLSTKPQYTMDEISSFMEQPDYKQLIYITQKYLGKMLTQQDINTLISFNDWLGLPIDVIDHLVEYCASNDHRNMKYIEAAAIDWADNGINTSEKAKLRTETFNKKYFHIMKALGIGNRTPTARQIAFMDKWFNTYKFDLELIIEACDKTINSINKPEFGYTDKVLSNWLNQNVKTLEDVKKQDLIHKSKQNNYTNKTAKQPSSKFLNYEQRTYDFDELEKKAMEMLLKESSEKRYLP
jgi:DnaD/phage-associated family protein